METRTPEGLRALVGSFTGLTETLARRITDRIRAEVEELRAMDDPEFWEVVESSSRANIAAGIAMVTGGARLPAASPLDAGAAARLAAANGISLAGLLRAYRIAHRLIWDEWVRAVEALDAPAAERTALLEQGSNVLFEFVDHVASLVTDEYTRERDSALRDREQRRVERVRGLIDGTVADTRDLGYELELEHLAVVAWGPGAEQAIRTLGAELERRVLLVPAPDGSRWGWLGAGEPLDSGGRRLLRRFAPSGASLALGDEREGPSGFRLSHREARDAQLVGQRLGAKVCHFHDVALEAFALRDERLAERFVRRELAGIDGDDDRSRKLRQTLRAYFAAADNAAAAAAALGVHDQTVTYRLRTIEERIGEPVTARRAELETALRLQRLLAPVEAIPVSDRNPAG